MKKIALTIIAALTITTIMAQAPQKINYQGVARDNTGSILATQNIGLRITIHQTSATGPMVYQETHNVTTNQFGLFNIAVGSGTVVTGSISTIDWGNDIHFIEIEMDETGGTSYQPMGTSQLLSVPYALYSEKTGQTYIAGTAISISGDTITNTAPDQIVTLTGSGATTVTGTYPNFTVSSTDNVNDADTSTTNEIQALSFSNDTLYLSNGGWVYLGAYLDNTDNQTLSINGDTLTISNGNSVVIKSCPPGTVDAGSFCIEINERAAQNYFNACAECVAAGGWLCSPGEWFGACQSVTGLSNMTDNWEWVDSGISYDAANNWDVGNIVGNGTCTTINPGTVTTIYNFRCCFAK